MIRITRRNLLVALTLGVLTYTWPATGLAQEAKIEIVQEDLDKLILTAIENYAELDLLQLQVNSNQIEKSIIKAEHLGLINLSGNLNEFSIRQIGGDNTIPNFYPRYNVGIKFNLNYLSNNRNKKKLNEQERQMIMVQSQEVTRILEEEVTKKYIAYRKLKLTLNLKKRMEQFSLADFQAAEQKFIEGELTLEKYNASRNIYYSNQMQVLESESQYLQAKTELESLVSAKLVDLGIE